MSETRRFTDEQLRKYLTEGCSQALIAQMFKVSRAAVSKRVAQLERAAALREKAVVTEAVGSVFDTRARLEENFRACEQLLTDPDVDPVAVRRLMLTHIQAALAALEKWYRLSEEQAFQDEVLAILDECEPGTRHRIIGRLRERLAVRRAFSPDQPALSAGSPGE